MKGVTPVVAVTLLMAITVAGAGTLYATLEGTQEDIEDSTPDLNLNSETLYMESCWVDGTETSLMIRNDASHAVNIENLDILVEGQEEAFTLDPDDDYPDNIVPPQQTFQITFTDIDEENITEGQNILLFTDQGGEMTFNCYT